jgi:hypothetical protein
MQHLVQLLGLQAVVLLQVPVVQSCPVPQLVQGAPFLPQAEGSVPALQMLPAQQPLQVPGAQLVEQPPW